GRPVDQLQRDQVDGWRETSDQHSAVGSVAEGRLRRERKTRSNGDARRRAVRRVGPRRRPTWRCWIGSETRTLRNPDGARVSNPIRQRASLRDARRTALRVTPLLRVSVFGRFLRPLRCLIRPGALDGVRGTVRYPNAFGL